jgi:hypothetical protein
VTPIDELWIPSSLEPIFFHSVDFLFPSSIKQQTQFHNYITKSQFKLQTKKKFKKKPLSSLLTIELSAWLAFFTNWAATVFNFEGLWCINRNDRFGNNLEWMNEIKNRIREEIEKNWIDWGVVCMVPYEDIGREWDEDEEWIDARIWSQQPPLEMNRDKGFKVTQFAFR